MLSFEKSKQAFKESSQYMPGGVNSPVRAFKNVGGNPLFISKGAGSHIFDIDGNEFIDYVLSWGPLILGHADSKVVTDLQAAVARGTSYGAPTVLETELAKKNSSYCSFAGNDENGIVGHRSNNERDSTGSRLYPSR